MAKQEIKAGVATIKFLTIKYEHRAFDGEGEYRLYLDEKDYMVLKDATVERIRKLRKLLGG